MFGISVEGSYEDATIHSQTIGLAAALGPASAATSRLSVCAITTDRARTHLINGGVHRGRGGPAGKARRPRIPGVFDGGATPPDGMHRRPNAGPIYEMGSRPMSASPLARPP